MERITLWMTATPAERAVLFGGYTDERGERDAELVQRLDAGLPLSKGDAAKARRLKKEAK